MDVDSNRRQGGARVRDIAAAVIGNALEWYDFVVFGYLTVVISRLFFPAKDDFSSLLLTTATFGVGFFTRPIGGIVLGLYADRHGRKAGLQLIITLMTIAVAMIAFAPTYASIGVAAPMLIVLARLLQGFATGGEFASATSFLVESAPPGKRGQFGSWQMVGQGMSGFLGSLAGYSVTHWLPPAMLDAWGWRLPFMFGLLIGPVGLYIRSHLHETRAFEANKAAGRTRVRFIDVLRANPRAVLASMGTVVCGTASFYVILVYMPTYASKQLHIALDQAYLAQLVGLACLTCVVVPSGMLSDRIGRKPVIFAALAVYLALLYPCYSWLAGHPTLDVLIPVQVIFCSLIGLFFGPVSTALAEQFPANVRSTATSFAYNIAVMLFGGFAQYIVTWLLKTTGSPIAPMYYLVFAVGVGLVAACFLREGVRDAA